MKSFLLLFFLASVCAFAGPIKEVDNKAYWLCKHRKEVRTVRVRVATDGMCGTFYSKYGAERSIGSGRNVESCVKFMDNVKTNLEKSGWACRDISGSKISSSLE